MNKHFPNHVEYNDYHHENDWISDNNCEVRITKDIVKTTFQSFSKNKTGGPDDLKPCVLQELPDNAYSIIAKLFRSCLANSYTPHRWREMKTVFIPKPGKKQLQ